VTGLALTLPPALADAGRRRAEGFPVASLLLPRRLRPAVAAFYRFARLADDIADAGALPPAQRIALLDALERALEGGVAREPWEGPAAALHGVLRRHGLEDRPARDLLAGFRRDAAGICCAEYADLEESCRLTAAPVGRFLLALHGAAREAVPASDALCIALQIIDHLRDAGSDWRELGRLYVPAAYLAAEGLWLENMAGRHTDARLRRVFDRLLADVDRLLAEAAPLPARIGPGGLARQAAVTLALARRWRQALASRDPLAGPVRLGPLAIGSAVLRGLWH